MFFNTNLAIRNRDTAAAAGSGHGMLGSGVSYDITSTWYQVYVAYQYFIRSILEA